MNLALLIIFSMDNHVDHSNHQNRESTNVGNNHLFGHAMTFHFGLNEVILFSFWSVNGLTGIIFFRFLNNLSLSL